MVNRPYDRELVIAALRQALPYIRLYRGRVFVVKAGGAMCADQAVLKDLALQLGVLCELGIRVVIVHGGGPQTTTVSEKLGLETTFVEGRRVTSPETLDVAVMTISGTVNTAILAACRSAQVPGIGVSGVDAGLVKAVRRPPQQKVVNGEKVTVDYGLVGDIVSVEPGVLNRLLDAGFVPVVSPLAADDHGQVLNINADTVASGLARALGAEKLIMLTDTAGLLEDRKDSGSLVSYTDVAGLDALQARGVIDGGMLPKVKAAKEALMGGVKRVHMVGYKGASSLLIEIFTNEGAGTLIVRDTAELAPSEHVEAS
jgi:acetylglutamate kinase